MFARNVWIQNVVLTSITTKHNSDTKYFNVKHSVKLTVKCLKLSNSFNVIIFTIFLTSVFKSNIVISNMFLMVIEVISSVKTLTAFVYFI